MICDTIYNAYIDYLVNPKYVKKPFTFGKMYHSGAFSMNELWGVFDLEDIENTFFLLTQKLIDAQYIVQLSEIKYFPDDSESQIIYLKPSYQLPKIENKSNQLLGNIHMELKTKADELVFLKIIVHRYNDSKWHAAHNFDTFMAFLFNDTSIDLY